MLPTLLFYRTGEVVRVFEEGEVDGDVKKNPPTDWRGSPCSCGQLCIWGYKSNSPKHFSPARLFGLKKPKEKRHA
jgi:hypothetical protein